MGNALGSCGRLPRGCVGAVWGLGGGGGGFIPWLAAGFLCQADGTMARPPVSFTACVVVAALRVVGLLKLVEVVNGSRRLPEPLLPGCGFWRRHPDKCLWGVRRLFSSEGAWDLRCQH